MRGSDPSPGVATRASRSEADSKRVATDGGIDVACDVDTCPNPATRPTTLDGERAHVCEEHALDYKRVEKVNAQDRDSRADYTVDARADGGVEVDDVETCRAVVPTTGCRCQNSARDGSDLCGVHENAEAVMTIDDRGDGTATDGGVVDDGIGLATEPGDDRERMNRARSSAQALVEWSIRAGVNPVTLLREELEERDDVEIVDEETSTFRVDTEGSA